MVLTPETLLSAFGERIGVQGIALNADNDVRVVFNERVVDIHYDRNRDIILFASTIANIIAVESSFVFANILELNLAHALTGAGTVGFDRRENKLHYVSFISMKGIDVDVFAEFIFSSIGMVEIWSKAVNSREFSERPMSFSDAGASFKA